MGISTLASLFSPFAPRAFHKSFAIRCLHTLSRNCRGVALNSNSHFETCNRLPWHSLPGCALNPTLNERCLAHQPNCFFTSLLRYFIASLLFLPSCATLRGYTNTQFHDY
jgi:hypothetical protein